VQKRATNLPFLAKALMYKALRRARLGQVYPPKQTQNEKKLIYIYKDELK
jgi:hypothetical protein